jgi:uncharacterized protein YcaQ
MAITIKADVARRYLVGRQGFLRRRGKQGVCDFIDRMGCVQMDPVSVVDRNHNLVLRNRVSDYSPRMLEELLYGERRLFEYWRNQKSILPIGDFPYAWYRMRHHDEFDSPYIDNSKRHREELRPQIEHVLSRIGREGPLSSADFAKEGRVPEKVANRVLQILWDSGDVMVHHVEVNRRAYDLTGRVLPAGTALGGVTLAEYRRFTMLRYLRADGLADPRDPWRFGWHHMGGPERKRAVEDLLGEGAIVPVRVEGIKDQYYALEEESHLLESDFTVPEGVLLMAPLDNLLWNRRLVTEVFGFSYAWEIYKMPEKRTYGCYCLPLLHGTRFIGRADPRLDRGNGVMVFNGVFMEPGVAPPVDEIADALAAFASYHGAGRVEVLATAPEFLKSDLEKSLPPSVQPYYRG